MTGTVTFVVLRDDNHVAQLATEHAMFDPDGRRVLLDDGTFLRAFPSGIAALTLRADGSLGVTLDRQRALSEAWIEDSFLRSR